MASPNPFDLFSFKLEVPEVTVLGLGSQIFRDLNFWSLTSLLPITVKRIHLPQDCSLTNTAEFRFALSVSWV